MPTALSSTGKRPNRICLITSIPADILIGEDGRTYHLTNYCYEFKWSALVPVRESLSHYRRPDGNHRIRVGLFRRNESIIRLSFGLFVLMSIATFITTQTGELAEHYLESINALDKAIFHEHEDAAHWANIGMYLTGELSLLTLFWQRARHMKFLPLLILIIAFVTFGLMAKVLDQKMAGIFRFQNGFG